MDRLTGHESYHKGMAWSRELVNVSEIALPGSGSLIKVVLETSSPIDMQDLNRMKDPTLANILSREMHGLLYRTARGKARAHIEHLDVHLGLEGLRAIRLNLFRCNGKKLTEQFDRLTDIEPIKPDQIRNLGALISTWEAELSRFYRIPPRQAPNDADLAQRIAEICARYDCHG